MSIGGFLGMGTRFVVVPYDTLKLADKNAERDVAAADRFGPAQAGPAGGKTPARPWHRPPAARARHPP